MPGFILHLTAAQILLKRPPHHPDFPYEISSVNDFLIGNLLPDTTKQKDASHFRNPAYYEKMMVFPDLTRFLQKYSSLLANPSVLGYYFHLYIDRKFFKDFIPQVVEFYDKNGQITDIRDEVATVYIQKSKTSIPFSKYLTEEYYYGDYTRMNTYLVNRYKIPLDLNPEVVNPGISEICYEDVQEVLLQLHGFLAVSPEAVRELKVFPLEELLLALEKNPEVVNPGISEICYEDVQEVLLQLHGFLAVSPEAVRELKVFPLEELLLALEKYVEEFLDVPNKYFE